MSWLFIDKEHQRQRDEAVTQWRALLRREVPVMRRLRPIPSLQSLSELERLQTGVIARDVADLARPREIERRRRPSIFVARLRELAAIEILFPNFPHGLPPDFFPVVKEELREFHERTPVASHFAQGPFTFGATFTLLQTPSEKFKAVPEAKQLALLRWGRLREREVLLDTFHHRSGPREAYGKTDAYSWDGSELKIIEKRVGSWVS